MCYDGGVESFNELTLSPELQRAIAELGYEKPSPIQAQALPILLGEATDFMGLAGTGTGKTAAFGIPMIEGIDASKKYVQALVLCPTRELAVQVTGQINLLGKYKGVKAVPVYGGSSFGDQVYALKLGAQIVVGTPGRVIDHITRETLSLANVKLVVLDEADEMISMGFKDELETILAQVPREGSRFWLFSATMSPEVRSVAHQYLRKAKQVQVNKKEMLPSSLEQFYYVSQEANKPEILRKLIDTNDGFYGLVFCPTKALVNDLTQYLLSRGYKVDCLHGDMDQRSRDRTMQDFRDRKCPILICTDVAARGLDVKDVTHVVNYSLPGDPEVYVHRIGRTARSGKSGVAMSLVTPANRRVIQRIEYVTKTPMQQGKIPSSKDVGTIKVSALLPKFQDQPEFERALAFLGEDWKLALTEKTTEEVVARMLAMFMPELIAPPEKNIFVAPERTGRRPGGDRPRGNFREGGDRPRGRFRDGPARPFRPRGEFQRPAFRDRDASGGAEGGGGGGERAPRAYGFKPREGGYKPRREGEGPKRFYSKNAPTKAPWKPRKER